MIEKTWLREQLLGLRELHLTTGGDTANKRIDKSHANDAICVTDLQPDRCDIKEWAIRPMRRQIWYWVSVTGILWNTPIKMERHTEDT